MSLVFFSLFSPGWTSDSEYGLRFFSEMRSLAKELLPTHYGTVEPLNRELSATDISGISRAWSDDVFWKRSDARLYGRVLHAKGSKHTSCKIRFEHVAIGQDALAAFFVTAGELLEAEYGAIHLTGTRTNQVDGLFQGITSRTLSMSLPGIPWLAYYGKPYTRMFGAERLLSCPAFRTGFVADGSVTVQSTEFLADAQSANEQFRQIQTDIMVHLGREAFFDSSNPDQTQQVPIFCFSQ